MAETKPDVAMDWAWETAMWWCAGASISVRVSAGRGGVVLKVRGSWMALMRIVFVAGLAVVGIRRVEDWRREETRWSMARVVGSSCDRLQGTPDKFEHCTRS